MGKKMGVSEKVAEARQRKQDSKSSAANKAKTAEEDSYWEAHANPKGKKDAKREEEEKKRLEAAAKKAELKRLKDAEEAEIANMAKKKAASKAQKVTAYELQVNAEKERRQREQRDAEHAAAQRKHVSEEDYAAQVEVENTNREDVAVEARSLDAALEQLSMGADGSPADRHPEKRAKAAWEAYYERMLPEMKEDKPGLKLMQYKSRIFEMWQRSPENPRNQPKAVLMRFALYFFDVLMLVMKSWLQDNLINTHRLTGGGHENLDQYTDDDGQVDFDAAYEDMMEEAAQDYDDDNGGDDNNE